jgi:hypothetical protein
MASTSRTTRPNHLMPTTIGRFKPRIKRHSYTEDEVNLIAYLRSQGCSYDHMRKAHFPSHTKNALSHIYSRLSPDERKYRASLVSASRNPPRIGGVPAKSASKTSRRCPINFSESGDEAVESSATSSEDEGSPGRASTPVLHRYNLRSRRPLRFEEKEPSLLVDRLRFPHFYTSYKNYQTLGNEFDTDYEPHSPTPDLSDRSPSVTPSIPSSVSSLELFGLEARSPSP